MYVQSKNATMHGVPNLFLLCIHACMHAYDCVCTLTLSHPPIWRHLLLCHYLPLSSLLPNHYIPSYAHTYMYWASLLTTRLLAGRFLFG